MRWSAMALVLTWCLALGPASAQVARPASDTVAASDSEFVPVDPSARVMVSGKTHVQAAYGIILGVLLLYAISILKRERTVKRAVQDLPKE